jgi:hypothetical protein
LHFEYNHWEAYGNEWPACTQKRAAPSGKKIGEYKWDMEMTTAADTADMAAGAGAAEAVAASAADAAEATEARAK